MCHNGGLALYVMRDFASPANEHPQCTFYFAGISGQKYKVSQGDTRSGHVSKALGYEAASKCVWNGIQVMQESMRRMYIELDDFNKRVPELEHLISQPWNGMEELDKLKQELEVVNRRIEKSLEQGKAA